MNELHGITIAALHDERWIARRSDPSIRHRRTLAARRTERRGSDEHVVRWRRIRR